MTLRQFLVSYGFLDNPSGNKARCPFHDDSSPSAMIHDDANTVWCFACRRLYGPVDFRVKYGVELDEVQDSQKVVNPTLDYPWGEVLFFS